MQDYTPHSCHPPHRSNPHRRSPRRSTSHHHSCNRHSSHTRNHPRHSGSTASHAAAAFCFVFFDQTDLLMVWQRQGPREQQPSHSDYHPYSPRILGPQKRLTPQRYSPPSQRGCSFGDVCGDLTAYDEVPASSRHPPFYPSLTFSTGLVRSAHQACLECSVSACGDQRPGRRPCSHIPQTRR